jgi:hypothetical protein
VSIFERVMVGVNVQHPGRVSSSQQFRLSKARERMLDHAAERAGLSRELWHRWTSLDNEVFVLPGDVDMHAVVRMFVSELDRQLSDHHEDHGRGRPIHLRVAMHLDAIYRDELSFTGPGFRVLQHLLGSAPLQAALADSPEANLALVASESLYLKTVVPELSELQRRRFRKVQVRLPDKDSQQVAYLYVSKEPPVRTSSRPLAVAARMLAPIRQEQAVDRAGAALQDVTIYTSSDDGERLQDALLEVLELCGFELASQEEPQRGSWFRRLHVRSHDAHAKDKLNQLAGKVERAAELRYINAPRSASDEREANAIGRLADAMSTMDEVVIRTSSLIFIKTNGRVVSWVLTEEEIRVLNDNPQLMKSPLQLLDALHQFQQQTTEIRGELPSDPAKTSATSPPTL